MKNIMLLLQRNTIHWVPESRKIETISRKIESEPIFARMPLSANRKSGSKRNSASLVNVPANNLNL